VFDEGWESPVIELLAEGRSADHEASHIHRERNSVFPIAVEKPELSGRFHGSRKVDHVPQAHGADIVEAIHGHPLEPVVKRPVLALPGVESIDSTYAPWMLVALHARSRPEMDNRQATVGVGEAAQHELRHVMVPRRLGSR